MLSKSIEGLLGYNNDALMMMEAFRSSSNVILTDNPPFSLNDFHCVFPVFYIEKDCCNELKDAIPECVFNLFKEMANSSIKEERYKNNWKYLMCLYIAHFLVLWIRTQNGDPSSENALKGSLPLGLNTSKSVDGLSVSTDFTWANDQDFSGYGTWKQTIYGQQLVSLTKIFGHGGMWVNG